MFAQKVISQIDEYLKLCEKFNAEEYKTFCQEIVALANNEYDNNIATRVVNNMAEAEENKNDDLLKLEYAFKEITEVSQNTNIINAFLDSISLESKKVYKKAFCSEINTSNLGELEEFVDLQRTLVLIDVSPFPINDIKFLKLSNTYSIPCQESFRKIASWSCGSRIENSQIYKYITIDDFSFKKAFDEIVNNKGNLNNIYQNLLKYKNEIIISEKASKLHELNNREYEIARCVIKRRRASIDFLQKEFNLRYGKAKELFEKLEETGVISCVPEGRERRALFTEKEFYEVHHHKGIDSENLQTDIFKFSPKEIFVAYCLYKVSFWMISKEFLVEVKEILEENPEINLPKLAIKLIKLIDRDDGLIDFVKEFKKEYEVTSEEVMVINQRYFLEKESAERSAAREAEREEKEEDALSRCRNCVYRNRCNTYGSINCSSYVPEY